jgi:PAS domain S-box-containing protein
MPGRTQKTVASSPPVPSDLDLACQALQEIKRHLKSIASVGGAAGPMAGLLLAAVDDCGDAVIVTNDEAEIHMVNGATARLTGISTRELQSLTVWDITHPNSQVDFDVLWREFLRAGRQRGHYTFRNREGGAVEVAYCSEANVLPQRHVYVLRRTGKAGVAGRE